MKKVLFVATVVKTHINVFHIPYLKMLKNMGYEVHVAARNDFESKEECVIPYCDLYHDMPFERNPFKLNNIKTYRQLKKLVQEEKFDIIHCHTPVGSVLTRLVYKSLKNKIKTKVIYTAHGFHFFKGAPLKNWLLYYPMEKYFSKYTDILITINEEDYQRAKDKFKMKQLEYILGVGVDIKYFQNLKVDIENKRRELGLSMEQKVLLSVGEINDNKNHKVVIEALNQLKNSQIIYMIAGIGNKQSELEKMAKNYGIEQQVKFIGYRNDIAELYKISDVFIFPSKREGLSVALMEAISSGIPCVVSRIRGNTDLIEDGINGYTFEVGKNFNVDNLAHTIQKILDSEEIRMKFRTENFEKSKQFSSDIIGKKMLEIYNKF